MTELPLLFDRSRFGISLSDDDSAQRISKLAGHFLISWVPVVVAKTNLRVGLCRFEKDAPAIFRHLHVIEMRPAFRADIHRSAQPDIFFLKSFGSHVVPPTEKVRQPLFQSTLQTLVFGKIHVVRNAFVKIHDVFPTGSAGVPPAQRRCTLFV